jgi:hypothetical protein
MYLGVNQCASSGPPGGPIFRDVPWHPPDCVADSCSARPSPGPRPQTVCRNQRLDLHHPIHFHLHHQTQHLLVRQWCQLGRLIYLAQRSTQRCGSQRAIHRARLAGPQSKFPSFLLGSPIMMLSNCRTSISIRALRRLDRRLVAFSQIHTRTATHAATGARLVHRSATHSFRCHAATEAHVE